MPVKQGNNYVIYKKTGGISELNARYNREQIDTVEKIFSDAVRRFGQTPALGTRQILGEEDEIQPDGKLMKKVRKY